MSTYSERPGSSGSQGGEGFYFTPPSASGSTYNSAGHDPAQHFDDSAFDEDFDEQGFSGAGQTTSVLPAGTPLGSRGPAGDYDSQGGPATGYSLLDEDAGRPPVRWHGGADFGLLVLRLAVGGVAIAHGLQHVFGMFGGPGIHGFARFLEAGGYQHPTVLAWTGGVTELAAGALLVLGLCTAAGAAGVFGVLANVVLLKWKLGFFAPGYEFELTLALAALALLFTGPGRVALDRPAPWFRHPVGTGLVFLVISAGATAAVWVVLHKPLGL